MRGNIRLLARGIPASSNQSHAVQMAITSDWFYWFNFNSTSRTSIPTFPTLWVLLLLGAKVPRDGKFLPEPEVSDF